MLVMIGRPVGSDIPKRSICARSREPMPVKQRPGSVDIAGPPSRELIILATADVAVTGPSTRLTTAGPRGEAIEVLDRVLQAVGWHDGPAELCPQFVGYAGPVAVMTDQAFAVCDRFDLPAVDMAGGGFPTALTAHSMNRLG